MKIRNLYELYGAEKYYREFSDNYHNPHFPEIKTLISNNLTKFNTQLGVLDFGAGGGEVSQILQQSGVQNIVGCDPYTFNLYEKNTGLPCLKYDFEAVLRGATLGKYSCIFSSFALHLCPQKHLFSVVWQLFEAAPQIVIITPHKRPALEDFEGIVLVEEDFALTERAKKVRLKIYERVCS